MRGDGAHIIDAQRFKLAHLERKGIPDHMREIAKKLNAQDNAQWFYSIQTPVIVWVAEGGKLVWINDAAVALTGLPAIEFLGSGWKRAVHQEDEGRLPATCGQDFLIRLRIRRMDGRYVHRWCFGCQWRRGYVGAIFEVGRLARPMIASGL